MAFRITTGIAFMAQIVLGSMCVMPMASADMMPSAHCEHCSQAPEEQHHAAASCADQCLSHATNAATGTISLDGNVLAMAAASPIIVNFTNEAVVTPLLHTASPPAPPDQNIVLRL